MSSRRQHSFQFKREAVEMIARQGLSVAEAARRLGISSGLLREWKSKFEQGGLEMVAKHEPNALEIENAKLRAENERLRMEREIVVFSPIERGI